MKSGIIVLMLMALTGCGVNKYLINQSSCKARGTTVKGHILAECEEGSLDN